MSVRISGMEGVSKAEARRRASSRRHVLHVASNELFVLVGAAVVAVIFVEALRGVVVADDF